MDDRYLRTGIFLAPFHAVRENPTLAIERDMALIEHLDRLNYHEAWVGEHHSGGFEIIASPEMFLAAAAQRTRHIRLGTGVVSLPYHNPFTLASRMMQLDHMARGRCMFGVGPGALVGDALRLGIEVADQRRMMNEGLDVIMELMQNRTVTQRTDWFNLVDAQLQLKPYSQPMMEMAVACSRSPVGAVAAGRHGIGLLSIGGTSDEALKAHAANWKIYSENAAANGKVADRRKWRIVTLVHIAPTREQARADMAFGLEEFCRYFKDVTTFPMIPEGVSDPAEYLTSSGFACIGTPDDCIHHFERLWLGSDGGFGGVLLFAHNAADWAATQRSYELMARYVHPHFQRNANAMRQASYDMAAGTEASWRPVSAQAVASEIERYKPPG
ncbi:MAG: LLM class flavin-dependent oxidoreductase [Acetobacteraceae bacterium]|nr:LLM class flavin-dependent oxidoreductase [Acetobacteraceae bacterium]